MLSVSGASCGTRCWTSSSLPWLLWLEKGWEGKWGAALVPSLHLCSWAGDTGWNVSYFPKDSLLKRGVNEVGNTYKTADTQLQDIRMLQCSHWNLNHSEDTSRAPMFLWAGQLQEVRLMDLKDIIRAREEDSGSDKTHSDPHCASYFK